MVMPLDPKQNIKKAVAFTFRLILSTQRYSKLSDQFKNFYT